ncbi:MAG: branched-chain amino acid ABC transporter permease [Ardenticatenia bacterium]|nr:branched-chain amino acid ABC transporter permease [Ardenticatenia bacterium]
MAKIAPVPEEAVLEDVRLKAPEVSLEQAAKLGGVAGIVAVFVSANGMVQAFAERDIISGILSMGYALLFLVPLIIAYLAAREPPVLEGFEAPQKGPRNVVAGLIVGAITGLFLVLFVLLASAVNLRRVFINISPQLLDLLTFGQGSGGLVLLAAGSLLMGAAGGLTQLLEAKWRRALWGAVAWTLLIGLLEVIVAQLFRGLGLNVLAPFFYAGTGGLTPVGAAIVFVIAFLYYWAVVPKVNQWQHAYAQMPAERQRSVRLSAVVAAVIVVAVTPQVLGPFVSEVLDLVGIFLLMGLGLNIVVGFAGLLDLGYVAFFAVGAYTTAILTSPASPRWSPEMSFWAALPFVILAAALAGIIVGTPVLRMRGDYLAIVTLGFGEIARLLLLSDWLRPVFGGAQGILKIPNLSIGPIVFRTPVDMFYPIVGFCLLAAYVSWKLKNSRIGRAWMAMREDEQVAEAMGVDIVEIKLKAFIVGAVIASFGGALFAVKIGSVFPHSFSLLVSITVLVLVIVGGLGSIPGVVVGTLALVGLPELLREFQEYRLLAYGVLLILMMLYRPEGLLPTKQWVRELHEEELMQDAWLKMEEDRRRAQAQAQTSQGDLPPAQPEEA